MEPRLLLAHETHAHARAGHRVVFGELPDAARAQKVAPAVAHVGDHDLAPIQDRRGQRGRHAA